MKKSLVTVKTAESGAPAALNRIGGYETAASRDYEMRHDELNSLIKRHHDNSPKDDGTDFPELIRTAESNLDYARENLQKWLKMLALFDKGVSPERREGERILVEEAKEIFAQFALSLDLAFEQCLIADAQSAALCDSPETFHKQHADNWRAAKDGAIDSAKKDGVIPAWLQT